jgi:diguanylate cyclase (GGDEF)-like protein
VSTLDIRTLAFILAAIIITESLVLIVVWRTRKTFSGFGLWTLASVVIASSFVLLGLRGAIPDFFSVVIANLLQIVGAILIFMGIRKYLDEPYHDYLNYLLAAVVMGFLVYFLYVHNDVNARILVVSCAWFIGCLRCALILLADVPTELRPSTRFAGGVFIALGLVHLLRGIHAWFGPPQTDLFVPDAVQAFVFTSWIVLAVGLTFGLFMMTTKRLELELAKLVRLAHTDDLTGAWNRRYLIEWSQREARRAHRYGHSLSMLAIDIDHFKDVNDTYGHAVGDLLLKGLASTAQSSLRASDVFARTGGEEFTALLPESDAAESLVVAERIKNEIGQVAVYAGSVPVTTTVSIGVASLSPDDRDIRPVFQRADAALYEAKRNGRNRVVVQQV